MLFIRKLIKDKKGATAIEYGLIAALIAVAAITAMSSLGGNLKNTFNNVSNNLGGSSSSSSGGSSSSSTSSSSTSSSTGG